MEAMETEAESESRFSGSAGPHKTPQLTQVPAAARDNSSPSCDAALPAEDQAAAQSENATPPDVQRRSLAAASSDPRGSQMNPSQSSAVLVNGHTSPTGSDKRQLVVTNGDPSSTAAIVLTAADGKYSLAPSQQSGSDIFVKNEPQDPLPPLASPAIADSIANHPEQQLYFITSDLVAQSSLKNSSDKQLDHRDLQTLQQVNGNHSPQSLDKRQLQLVTNGDHGSGTIVLTTADAEKEFSLSHGNVLQPHEIYIKAEPLDPMPPLASPANAMDVVTSGVTTVSSAEKMRELEGSPPATVISLAPAQPYPRATAQLTFATPAYDIAGSGQYTVQVNAAVSPPQYTTVTQNQNAQNNGTVYLTTDYITYRDYYPAASTVQTATSDQYQTVRQQLSSSPAVTYSQAANEPAGDGQGSFLDRYLRQPPVTSTTTNGAAYKGTLHGGLTVDLPSPDSGIGEATVTPRAENGALAQAPAAILPVSASTALDQSTVTTLSVAGPATPGSTGSNSNASTPSTSTGTTKSSRRSWHEYGRNSEVDKVQIPKIFSDVGFKYYLESPISTSQRREDDRITYINKGQFYGVTLEYIPDPDRPLKSATVKSLMLLVFREEKSHEDEIKAWQFWHSRQHSIKQRILDADTKNSSGIIGPIEEVTHNSISFYWNPLEGPAKINIAVQCLSTDFSNQKGVKGLPLHLQIDTFDDIREGSVPINRGYGQIKVFCDKGAERKTRDEERRAAKRKLSATGNGRKKIEDMYHPVTERSEFYTMADVHKPPVLFTPSEELEKQINSGEMNFYTGQSGDLSAAGFESSSNSLPPIANNPPAALIGIDHKKHIVDRIVDPLTASVEMAIAQPPVKRMKIYPPDRVLIYAKQENEEVFHPLHLLPPSLVGLAVAIQNKYKLEAKNIRHIFKRCRKGITVQMDDDMVKHYSNEDTCLLEVHQVDEHTHDITLVEYDPN